MMFDEFVRVRFSKVDSQFLANIPDPNPDLALSIDKLNPLNENDFSQYEINHDESVFLGEQNTSLVPVKKKSIFDFFFIDKSKKAEMRERKRKMERSVF